MESLKTKYDRVVLGVCALIALVVGVLLLMKVMSFGSQFPTSVPTGKEKADLGDLDPAKIDQTIAGLGESIVITPKQISPTKAAQLFVSAPVVKTADGNSIALLDEGADQVRPPLPNEWIYKNDLDITRMDIATADSDGDGYDNTAEFEAGSDPRNRASTPPPYSKLSYAECVKEPLTLRFSSYSAGSGEIQLKRILPEPSRTGFVKVGDDFLKEGRFTIANVEFREITTDNVTKRKPVLILKDALNPTTPLEIVEGETIEHPALSARIVDGLSGKEFVMKEKAEFEIPSLPGVKFLVKTVTEEAATLSAIIPPSPDRIDIKLELKP